MDMNMKTYIKPETITAEMLTAENLLDASLKTGTKLKDEVSATSYTKSDNAWDDFDE